MQIARSIFFARNLLLMVILGIFSPTANAEYCVEIREAGHFRKLAQDENNLMAFQNHGGLINGGVCWWHSLFQRAAIYLTVYRPELPKPDRARARALIHAIAAGRRVVEIPGYRNFREFSAAYESEIQRKLEQWQKVDGFLKQEWLRGISGSPQLPRRKMAKRIAALKSEMTNSDDLHWSMLQLPGLPSHAWLLVDAGGGSREAHLEVLDSNTATETDVHTWIFGDRTIGGGVPYIGKRQVLERFREAQAKYCAAKDLGRNVSNLELESDQLENDFD